ncbi:MAG: FHA domain-containing protein, partial [Myxococcota bacterium]
QDPTGEVEGASEEGLISLSSRLHNRTRAGVTLCPERHVLFKGQRPEDCFDCHLIALARAEWAQEKRKTATQGLQGALLCLRGFHEGAAFALRLAEDTPLYIGSDPDCDVVLSDPQISRRHLLVVSRQGRTIVRDLNSLRHSALRARQELQWYVLDPEREYWCEDGANLILGDVELLFRTSDADAQKLANPPPPGPPSAVGSPSFPTTFGS